MQFVLAEYLRDRLKLSVEDLSYYEEKDVLHPVEKNGRVFYSSRDAYRLRGILHFMRTEGLTFDAAKERIDGRIAFPAQVPARNCRN